MSEVEREYDCKATATMTIWSLSLMIFTLIPAFIIDMFFSDIIFLRGISAVLMIVGSIGFMFALIGLLMVIADYLKYTGGDNED